MVAASALDQNMRSKLVLYSSISERDFCFINLNNLDGLNKLDNFPAFSSKINMPKSGGYPAIASNPPLMKRDGNFI